MRHSGKLFALLVTLILIMALYGCKPLQEVAQSDTTSNVTVAESIRDTTIYMTDSAGLYALLYCDSIGQARVRQIEQFYAGQFIRPKVVIRDNWLKVNCKIDSAAVTVRWKETHRDSTQTIYRVVVNTVKHVPGWAYACIYFTLFILVVGLLVGAYFLIKNSTWWAWLLTWAGSLIKKLFTRKG